MPITNSLTKADLARRLNDIRNRHAKLNHPHTYTIVKEGMLAKVDGYGVVPVPGWSHSSVATAVIDGSYSRDHEWPETDPIICAADDGDFLKHAPADIGFLLRLIAMQPGGKRHLLARFANKQGLGLPMSDEEWQEFTDAMDAE